jgi:hypothetical protein
MYLQLSLIYRARRISENAFSILVNRWRLYHRKIPLQPENVDAVIKATCVLHNMLQKRGTPVPQPPQPTDETDRIDAGFLREFERVGHSQKKVSETHSNITSCPMLELYHGNTNFV